MKNMAKNKFCVYNFVQADEVVLEEQVISMITALEALCPRENVLGLRIVCQNRSLTCH